MPSPISKAIKPVIGMTSSREGRPLAEKDAVQWLQVAFGKTGG